VRRSLSRVRLPLAQGHMAPTRGDRDETCTSYEGCLDAHVRAYPDAHASCPKACRWRAARPAMRATPWSGTTNLGAGAP
jgi:hypothetical protein